MNPVMLEEVTRYIDSQPIGFLQEYMVYRHWRECSLMDIRNIEIRRLGSMSPDYWDTFKSRDQHVNSLHQRVSIGFVHYAMVVNELPTLEAAIDWINTAGLGFKIPVTRYHNHVRELLPPVITIPLEKLQLEAQRAARACKGEVGPTWEVDFMLEHLALCPTVILRSHEWSQFRTVIEETYGLPNSLQLEAYNGFITSRRGMQLHRNFIAWAKEAYARIDESKEPPTEEPRPMNTPEIEVAVDQNDTLIAPDNKGIKPAMDVVIQAMYDDPSYTWGWHANIAMAMRDEGVDCMAAQRGAARFLSILTTGEGRTAIDTRTFDEYKSIEAQYNKLQAENTISDSADSLDVAMRKCRTELEVIDKELKTNGVLSYESAQQLSALQNIVRYMKVNEINRRLALGEQGSYIASVVGVSDAYVSQVKKQSAE